MDPILNLFLTVEFNTEGGWESEQIVKQWIEKQGGVYISKYSCGYGFGSEDAPNAHQAKFPMGTEVNMEEFSNIIIEADAIAEVKNAEADAESEELDKREEEVRKRMEDDEIDCHVTLSVLVDLDEIALLQEVVFKEDYYNENYEKHTFEKKLINPTWYEIVCACNELILAEGGLSDRCFFEGFCKQKDGSYEFVRGS